MKAIYNSSYKTYVFVVDYQSKNKCKVEYIHVHTQVPILQMEMESIEFYNMLCLFGELIDVYDKYIKYGYIKIENRDELSSVVQILENFINSPCRLQIDHNWMAEILKIGPYYIRDAEISNKPNFILSLINGWFK